MFLTGMSVFRNCSLNASRNLAQIEPHCSLTCSLNRAATAASLQPEWATPTSSTLASCTLGFEEMIWCCFWRWSHLTSTHWTSSSWIRHTPLHWHQRLWHTGEPHTIAQGHFTKHNSSKGITIQQNDSLKTFFPDISFWMHVVYGVPCWHDWILSRPSFQITIVSVDLLFVQSRFLLQIFGESILVSSDSYVAMSCRYNIPGAMFKQPWHWNTSTVKQALSLQQQ